MLNIKELHEKYPNGFGYGGNPYYEINSDIPYQVNCYGGKLEDYIVNDNGEVQCYGHIKATYQYFKGDIEITEEEYRVLYDSDVYYEFNLKIKSNNTKKWFAKTIENYYLWPYYPDREIIAFEIMKGFPLFDEGTILEVDEDNLIRSNEDWEMAYYVEQCLKYPTFFKPLYE